MNAIWHSQTFLKKCFDEYLWMKYLCNSSSVSKPFGLTSIIPWSLDTFDLLCILCSFEPAIVLNPGDEIRYTCHFQSRDRQEVTYRGQSAMDEMCEVLFVYYPAQNMSKCSADGEVGYICIYIYIYMRISIWNITYFLLKTWNIFILNRLHVVSPQYTSRSSFTWHSRKWCWWFVGRSMSLEFEVSWVYVVVLMFKIISNILLRCLQNSCGGICSFVNFCNMNFS